MNTYFSNVSFNHSYSPQSSYYSPNIYSSFSSNSYMNPNSKYQKNFHQSSTPPPGQSFTQASSQRSSGNSQNHSHQQSQQQYYKKYNSSFTNAKAHYRSDKNFNKSTFFNNFFNSFGQTASTNAKFNINNNFYSQFYGNIFENEKDSFSYSYFNHTTPEDIFLILEDPYEPNKMTVQMTRTQIGPNGEQQRITIERDFKNETELNKFLNDFEQNLSKAKPNKSKSIFSEKSKIYMDDFKSPGVVVVEEPGEEPRLYRQDTGELLSSPVDSYLKGENNEHPNECPKRKQASSSGSYSKMSKEVDDLIEKLRKHNQNQYSYNKDTRYTQNDMFKPQYNVQTTKSEKVAEVEVNSMTQNTSSPKQNKSPSISSSRNSGDSKTATSSGRNNTSPISYENVIKEPTSDQINTMSYSTQHATEKKAESSVTNKQLATECLSKEQNEEIKNCDASNASIEFKENKPRSEKLEKTASTIKSESKAKIRKEKLKSSSKTLNEKKLGEKKKRHRNLSSPKSTSSLRKSKQKFHKEKSSSDKSHTSIKEKQTNEKKIMIKSSLAKKDENRLNSRNKTVNEIETEVKNKVTFQTNEMPVIKRTKILYKSDSLYKKPHLPRSESVLQYSKLRMESEYRGEKQADLKLFGKSYENKNKRFSQVYERHKTTDPDILFSNENYFSVKKDFPENIIKKTFSKSVDTGLSEGSKSKKDDNFIRRINENMVYQGYYSEQSEKRTDGKSRVGSFSKLNVSKQHNNAKPSYEDDDEFDSFEDVEDDEDEDQEVLRKLLNDERNSTHNVNYEFYSYENKEKESKNNANLNINANNSASNSIYYPYFRTQHSPAFFQPNLYQIPRNTLNRSDMNVQKMPNIQPQQPTYFTRQSDFYSSWYGSTPTLKTQSPHNNRQSLYFS